MTVIGPDGHPLNAHGGHTQVADQVLWGVGFLRLTGGGWGVTEFGPADVRVRFDADAQTILLRALEPEGGHLFLSGGSEPAVALLRAVCDAFGVDESAEPEVRDGTADGTATSA